jgi:hypothetical protein
MCMMRAPRYGNTAGRCTIPVSEPPPSAAPAINGRGTGRAASHKSGRQVLPSRHTPYQALECCAKQFLFPTPRGLVSAQVNTLGYRDHITTEVRCLGTPGLV